jgi:hypothetical protein
MVGSSSGGHAAGCPINLPAFLALVALRVTSGRTLSTSFSASIIQRMLASEHHLHCMHAYSTGYAALSACMMYICTCSTFPAHGYRPNVCATRSRDYFFAPHNCRPLPRVPAAPDQGGWPFFRPMGLRIRIPPYKAIYVQQKRTGFFFVLFLIVSNVMCCRTLPCIVQYGRDTCVTYCAVLSLL